MGLYYLKHKDDESQYVIVSNNKDKLERYAKKNNLDFHNRLVEVEGDIVVSELQAEEMVVMEEDATGERARAKDSEDQMEEDGIMEKLKQ